MISNIGGTSRDSRQRQHALQELCVRLFFCDATAKAYGNDPETFLHERGLRSDDRRLLPDVTSSGFDAESHGRRFIVALELFRRFEQTIRRLDEAMTNPAAFTRSSVVRQFLASDYFLSSHLCLPHPFGSGYGYESVSKFFFWLKSAFSLDSAGVRPDLRVQAYGDFGRYIVASASYSRLAVYQPFAKGTLFAVAPECEEQWCVVWRDLRVATVSRKVCPNITAQDLPRLDRLLPGGAIDTAQDSAHDVRTLGE
jgi:hypothetical protein